jgi:hypothetical protein
LLQRWDTSGPGSRLRPCYSLSSFLSPPS